MTTLRRVAATAVALAALTLAGCTNDTGTDQPDAAACEQAMRAQYQTALDNPDAPAGSRPAACNGIADSTLEEIAGKIIGEQLTP